MRAVRIVPLIVADVPEAGALLAASHRDYPAFCHVFPDPAKRARVLGACQTTATRDAARHGHALAAYRDGHLVGVALWMPPGRFPPGPLRALRMAAGLGRAALADPANFPRFARDGAALAMALPQYQVGVSAGTRRPSRYSARRRRLRAAGRRSGRRRRRRPGLSPAHLRSREPELLPEVGIRVNRAEDPQRTWRADLLRNDPPTKRGGAMSIDTVILAAHSAAGVAL